MWDLCWSPHLARSHYKVCCLLPTAVMPQMDYTNTGTFCASAFGYPTERALLRYHILRQACSDDADMDVYVDICVHTHTLTSASPIALSYMSCLFSTVLTTFKVPHI